MKKTRIMVFGTFDYLHPGHLNFFKQARALATNPYLVVSIARDQNVKRIKKHLPTNAEKDRKFLVSSCRLVDEVVLGGIGDFIPHIIKAKPEIIALGYDQSAYTDNLAGELKKNGLIVKVIRLKAYKGNTLKTKLFKQKEVEI